MWGVHGMGGFTGTILIGIFASNSHLLTNPSSWYFLGIQVIGVIITAVYAYVLTTVILKSAMHFTTITTTKKNKKKDWTFLLWLFGYDHLNGRFII